MRHVCLGALVLLAAGCGNDVNVVGQAGQLVVSPGFTDVGTLAVGETTSGTLELTAVRGRVTVVAVETLNVQGDWFAVEDPTPLEVEADTTATLTFTYAPGAPGFHWAEITLQTDEVQDNAHTVQVRGQGADVGARLWPALVDAGPVDAGGTGAATFVVANEGGVDLEITAVTFTDAAFSVAGALPIEVPAGGRVDLPVTFASDGAPHRAELTVALGGAVELPPVVVQANWCEAPDGPLYDQDGDGRTTCAGDCDDADASAWPGAPEACDGADDDCDGAVDEGTTCGDDDGDGYSEDEGDCNDADASMSPGAAELEANGKDDDCDGVTDAGNGDVDGDGLAEWAGDCDDADADTHPGAPERADGVDNDCDGVIDEGTTASDDDGDGWTEVDGDCDDTDAAASPTGVETADGADNDCDGLVDEGTTRSDDDGDGFTEAGGDCDDSDPAVNPAELEVVGNGIDDDCDGTTR